MYPHADDATEVYAVQMSILDCLRRYREAVRTIDDLDAGNSVLHPKRYLFENDSRGRTEEPCSPSIPRPLSTLSTSRPANSLPKGKLSCNHKLFCFSCSFFFFAIAHDVHDDYHFRVHSICRIVYPGPADDPPNPLMSNHFSCLQLASADATSDDHGENEGMTRNIIHDVMRELQTWQLFVVTLLSCFLSMLLVRRRMYRQCAQTSELTQLAQLSIQEVMRHHQRKMVRVDYLSLSLSLSSGQLLAF